MFMFCTINTMLEIKVNIKNTTRYKYYNINVYFMKCMFYAIILLDHQKCFEVVLHKISLSQIIFVRIIFQF